MACADKKHGDDLGFMALGLPHSIYANQPLHQLLRINVHKQMVCKFWKRFQHLERINMCYVYIRLGSQVDKGIAWGLSPIKKFTPPPTPVGNLGYHFESVDSQRPWPP